MSTELPQNPPDPMALTVADAETWARGFTMAIAAEGGEVAHESVRLWMGRLFDTAYRAGRDSMRAELMHQAPVERMLPAEGVIEQVIRDISLQSIEKVNRAFDAMSEADEPDLDTTRDLLIKGLSPEQTPIGEPAEWGDDES